MTPQEITAIVSKLQTVIDQIVDDRVQRVVNEIPYRVGEIIDGLIRTGLREQVAKALAHNVSVSIEVKQPHD